MWPERVGPPGVERALEVKIRVGLAMADKGALELIGVALLTATLLVVSAAGFVVRNQLAAEAQRADNVEVAQLPTHLPTVNATMAPQLVK